MSTKRLTACFCTVLAGAALAAGTSLAADPVPVLKFDSVASATNAAAVLARTAPDDFSIAFWVRFDDLPSKVSATSLIGCTADKQGIVTIALRTPPTEFGGDYTMRTKVPIKRKEWHHIGITYCRVQWRASFYLDGKLQWENDNLNLPDIVFGEVADTGFKGAVRDFRLYDCALQSEDIVIEMPGRIAEACAAVRAEAAAALAAARNAALRKWIESVARRAEGFAADPAPVTISQIRNLRRECGNAARIAGEFARPENAGAAGGAGAIFVVPPLRQEIFLPYDLPASGGIAAEMRVAACRGEYENGSAIVVPFAPMTIGAASVSDLKGPGGKVIKASEIDVKYVKRWIRGGLCWFSYHSDRRQRNLVPDLLVNDLDVIRVDEIRRRNYLRLDYPTGRIYADVSDPIAYKHLDWCGYMDQMNQRIPLYDAKTLQPCRIDEAGRNQQYLFTFHVPGDAAAGVYNGTISFGGVGTIAVRLCVLPFDLPRQPSPYDNLDRIYISHMNSLPGLGFTACLPTLEEKFGWMKRVMQNISAHNLNHTTGVWNSPEYIKLALEAGFVPDRIFGLDGPGDWRSFFPGVPQRELTAADKHAGLRCTMRAALAQRDFFRKHLPDAVPYAIYFSEAGAFPQIGFDQAELAEGAQRMGAKVFAHGFSANTYWSSSIQDMQSTTSIERFDGDTWHAGGGEVINYAYPFPGPENPEHFRRLCGFDQYKAGRFDGHMLHGFIAGRTPWNEFSDDPGGDGNYRNFSMCYPTGGDPLYKIAWEGLREAYDDLRYATRLKQIATANMEAADIALRREARRALLWLDLLDGKKCDLDMTRAGIAGRIILLQDMVAGHGGVLPPAEQAAAKRGRKTP